MLNKIYQEYKVLNVFWLRVASARARERLSRRAR